MFVSFNKAFKQKHIIPDDIKVKSEMCAQCCNLIYIVADHHWVYVCSLDKCSFKEKTK